MSPWITWLLPKIGRALAGVRWAEAVQFVIDLSHNRALSGADKRDLVKIFLTDGGLKLAGHLLNLIVELAVAWCAAKGELGDRPPS